MNALLSTFLILFVVALVSPALAQEIENNRISLRGGVDITLPAWPNDPEQLAQFSALTPLERESFYFKRKILIEKIAAGVAKPGIGRAIRWTKNKVTTTIGAVKSRFSKAQVAMGEGVENPALENGPLVESVIEFEKLPDNMSEATKIFVESTVTALVNNFWTNSTSIAKSSSLGLTFVMGAIWNTTFAKWGYVAGRSLSVDVGVDFNKQSGYMNFFYDKQSLSRGGFSIDVGLMVDVLIHVTDSELEDFKTLDIQHEKLPMIGCFRRGPSYIAWGGQMGLHVVEMAGIVATAFGHPEVGLTLIPAVRATGMATIYKTDLKRKYITGLSFSKDSRWMGILGLSKAQTEEVPATPRLDRKCSQIFVKK